MSGTYNNPSPLQERPESHTDLAHRDDPREGQTTVAVPEGYKSVEEFLEEARSEFQLDLDADKYNREEGLADLEFLAGHQWDPAVKKEREAAGRPCMTVNTLPQFVGQVVGDRRMNEVSIHAVPKNDNDVELAEVRSGLIRSIEQQSKAARVYDRTLEDQVGGGIGNMRVVLEYAEADVFEQDIFIRPIRNPFAVVWDRMAIDPTGRDAKRCFVQDIIPRKEYDRRWGDIAPVPSDISEFVTGGISVTAGSGGGIDHYGAGWVDKDSVRITEYWRLVEKPIKICMLQDGSTHEMADGADPIDVQNIMLDENQQPIIRDSFARYAVMYLITGWDILEGPYELRLNRLPIVRAIGREVRIGERVERHGLIRWARDAIKMRNYWRSVAVETLAMAPKNQWLAEYDAVKGREDEFREAHLTNDPLLIYNTGKKAPSREQGPQLPAAVLQEVNMNTQDIKDTTGLQDASLGIRSNEVSGKAIWARQQEGDVATIVYHDNLNMAIEEVGDICNQLIPVCYDTTREIRVLGQDMKAKIVKINDPNDPKSPDLSKGKYDIQVITGPSATTQRMFAADAMLEAIKVNPQLMQVAGDLIVAAQDWPKAQEIAERLKKVMPPQLTQDPDQPPTPEQMQQQQLAQQQQQLQITAAQEQEEHGAALRQLELQEKQAVVEKIQGEARRAHTEADLAEARTASMDVENSVQSATAGPRVARQVHDLSHVPDLPPDMGENETKAGKPLRLTGRSYRRVRAPVQKSIPGVSSNAPKL